MRRTFFVLGFLLVCLPTLSAQASQTAEPKFEEIIMVNNHKYVGEVLEKSPDLIRLRLELGGEISLVPGNVASEKAINPDGDYFSLGGSFGTPAGLNLILNYTQGKAVFGVEGFSLSEIRGVEVSIGYLISKFRYFNQAVKLNVGYSELPDSSSPKVQNTWRFIGAAYHIALNSFFFEIGATYGLGSYSNPQGDLQIGYLYDFN